MIKVLTVFGTRPEAIKMFPVVHALQATRGLTTTVAVTASLRVGHVTRCSSVTTSVASSRDFSFR